MNVSHLIFDLDGTLIDSAPAILACMRKVVLDAGYSPVLPLNASLIGPPLTTTLGRIIGSTDPDSLRPLTEAFKHQYDNEGLRSTKPYPGIPAMLRLLHDSGVRLHLATNKRMRPTLAILDMLGWRELFASIGCQDSVTPGYANKTAMLEQQLPNNSIDPTGAAYIGDTREDGLAAASNGLHFIAADWGYGDFNDWAGPPSWSRAADSAALLKQLQHPAGNR